jgi:hypothetical protein
MLEQFNVSIGETICDDLKIKKNDSLAVASKGRFIFRCR